MIDVELWLRGRLAARFPEPDYNVATETDNDLDSLLPFIRVVRVGGRDKQQVLDLASVSIDVFAASRAEARAVAELVRDFIRTELPQAPAADGAAALTAQTISAPAWRPWDNTGVRRVGALYDITIQRME